MGGMSFGIQNTLTRGARHLCTSHRVAPGQEIANVERPKKMSFLRLKLCHCIGCT